MRVLSAVLQSPLWRGVAVGVAGGVAGGGAHHPSPRRPWGRMRMGLGRTARDYTTGASSDTCVSIRTNVRTIEGNDTVVYTPRLKI